ncbi:MAG: ABC transporter permease subunit [Nonomuraea sp.]|nr:ABC transporter permease subunit [Nonomuraea sp.]NUP65908.1 ABC transporter permease subunit [Nonomuraea sp.]NUP79257.1 ABC transporter permease subunit [Nonomuraea sp.]NUS08564.1 ABC transporter permease subunit [Nonomuraea sp.]NUT42381.1 ABC transporter permease subunit [Thermoactinospora sp.]
MIAVIRAELLKLTTTRLWWIMLIVMLAYSALPLGFTIAFAGQQGFPERGTRAFQEILWGLGQGGVLFAAVLGVVMMTAEYRYQTITTTFLVTPRRVRVVAAKLAATLVVGVLLGLAVLVLTALAVVVTTLAAGGALVFDGTTVRVIAGVLAALALYTLFGLGLGALIKNQVAAILATVAWVYVVDSIINAIPALQPVGKWTPGGAASALTSTVSTLGGVDTSYLLPAWAGAVVLLGYALLFSAVASLTTLRRDIT